MLQSIHNAKFTGRILAAISLCFVSNALAAPEYRYIAFYPVPLAGEPEINGPAPAFSAGPVTPSPGLLLETSIEQYRGNIHDLETSGGPFNPMVAQQAEALGDLLQQAGNHKDAIEAFEKSFHILRINEGLYSTNQEKVLRKSIMSQLELGDVDMAGTLRESLLHQQKRLHEKGSDGYITAILEWADWNVDRLVAEDTAVITGHPVHGASISANLITAQENYIEAIGLIRESGRISQAHQDRLVHAERKLAAINYIANSKTALGSTTYKPTGNDNDLFTVAKQQDNKTEMAFFFNGSSALNRAIAYSLESPQPDYLSIAEQMMALGDWYLLFDRRAAALSIYEDAYEVLNAVQASEHDIRKIMTPGMPVAAPDSLESNLAGTAYHGYIDVEFQVSKFGIATSPEVIATSEQEASPVTKALIRKIRQEKFRPAFIDGSASSSENVKLRYYYSYN